MKKPHTLALSRDQVVTAHFALANYIAQLEAEIHKPTREHGPSESAAALIDARPLQEVLDKWLEANPR